MKTLIPGHEYQLDNLKGEGSTFFTFFMDPALHNGHHLSGPSTQEVIRMCIARVKSLNKEKPWWGNKFIVYHLRMALILFEIRALIQKVKKGQSVENYPTQEDGHIFG
jgi:hypothetical protein